MDEPDNLPTVWDDVFMEFARIMSRAVAELRRPHLKPDEVKRLVRIINVLADLANQLADVHDSPNFDEQMVQRFRTSLAEQATLLNSFIEKAEAL